MLIAPDQMFWIDISVCSPLHCVCGRVCARERKWHSIGLCVCIFLSSFDWLSHRNWPTSCQLHSIQSKFCISFTESIVIYQLNDHHLFVQSFRLSISLAIIMFENCIFANIQLNQKSPGHTCRISQQWNALKLKAPFTIHCMHFRCIHLEAWINVVNFEFHWH